MSPLPCWLAGAQSVALNMSNNDLPVQLHYALFKGSGGYVLKPAEMRVEQLGEQEDAVRWPPARVKLHHATIHVLSLHNLPKRGEQRPRYSGSRGACHQYARQLSGSFAPPNGQDLSSPGLQMAVHSIGGFCAISGTMPLAQQPQTEISVSSVQGNGINATFGHTVHCLASEPDASFLRIGVTDSGAEVAYEIAVLGRLRAGYRVFQMRGPLGTRIELCYLFVRITLSSEPNTWATPRQQEKQLRSQHKRIEELEAALKRREMPLSKIRGISRVEDEARSNLSSLPSSIIGRDEDQRLLGRK